MAWINVFLVALGLMADFSIRSPDSRTSDWAISLVVLGVIAIMVSITSLYHWTTILLKSLAAVLPGIDDPAHGLPNSHVTQRDRRAKNQGCP